MAGITRNIRVNGEKLKNDIQQIEGERFKATNISTFLLGMEKTYFTTVVVKGGTINPECFDKLCAYYDLDKNDYITKEVQEEKVKAIDKVDTKQVETIVVGLNVLYEEQKNTNELLAQLLEQVRIENTKLNRLENALGQILTNTIQIKDKDDDIYKEAKEIKSSTAVINGRVRDIMNKVNKEG